MKAILFATLIIASTSLSTAWADQVDRSASGDHLTVPAQTTSSMKLPRRGMSMQTVTNGWGKAPRQLSAVGNPPISRWIYPGFTVYFEYNHVIHSVQHTQAKAS